MALVVSATSQPLTLSLVFMHLSRFIVDGIITLPIALYGFLMFPDVPTTTKAFYLSDEVSIRCHI